MAALSAAHMKDSIVALINENHGAELDTLIAAINNPGNNNIGPNVNKIRQIMPALLARERLVATEGTMTHAEAKVRFDQNLYKSHYTVLERYFSPIDPVFDNIGTLAGLNAFQQVVEVDNDRARQIVEDCMDHIQTFIYPLIFSNYLRQPSGGAAIQPFDATYGPATSSMPHTAATTKYIATPLVPRGFGVMNVAVDNVEMWQYPPNCLYQSQIPMKDGYAEGETFAVGFKTGDILANNCMVKTFVKHGQLAPVKEYPYDDTYLKGAGKYDIYIRRSDSMAIFVEKASGKAVREMPSNIYIKRPTIGRYASDQCNYAIANYVGSMLQAPLTVVQIQPNNTTVEVKAASAAGYGVLNVAAINHNIAALDLQTIPVANMGAENVLMALRMCARMAFWRYRAVKPSSKGGSNKMMITNMSNKTRNMNKRQRRSKSKSKSKSKSMSMFKSAKRAFYRTNKRNKTSKKY